MSSITIPEITDNDGKYSETIGPFILAFDILEVIAGVVAALINSLAIYILTAKLKLKQSDTIISFMVSIFDIIFSIFTVINCIVLWITNHSAIHVPLYSQFAGYLSFCLGSCAIDSIMLLSLIRFLAIYKKVQFGNRFWVILSLTVVIFNFLFGLIPLIQNQFKVQPSLKYSSVEFNTQNNWSINFYYFIAWIKLAIDMVITVICYFFISLFYYNYLKNYSKEEVEDSERSSKVNRKDLDGIQFDKGSIQLELDIDSNFQTSEERRSVRGVSNHTAENSVTSTREQPDFRNNYTIDSLIRSTLIKIYIMLIIYLLVSVPFFLIQTLFKFLSIPISSALDAVGYFLLHLIPIANPCFVLFLHFETYQELRFFICLKYYKFLN